MHTRKCLIVGTHLVEVYVALSFWSQTCTYILVDVEARTCRSRGAHVACTRTYSGQGARKKIWYILTYGRGLERLLVHMYSQGLCTWLGRNGETASSSCSWGGNGMRRVHQEATERVGANRLGRNSRWKRGPAYGRTEETTLCSTGHVRNEILFIGRGLAYRKTEEKDLLRSKRGSC